MLQKFLVLSMLVLGLALPISPKQATAATSVQGPFQLSTSAFNFFYAQGGGKPTLLSGTFTNISGSTVNVGVTMANQPGWINSSFSGTEHPLTPNTPSGLGIAVNVDGLSVGTYTTAIQLTGNFTGSPIQIPVSLTVAPADTPLPQGYPHPEDTHVLTPDGTVWRIVFGMRMPYTSAGAFLSYGYNSWDKVVPANSADMALQASTAGYPSKTNYIPPRDGSLINDKGTIYIVSDWHRRGFSSAKVFLDLGYSFNNAIPGDTSFLTTYTPISSSKREHAPGTVINDNGTLCFLQSPFRAEDKTSGRQCFSSMTDFYDWGFKLSEVVPANSYDRNLPLRAPMYSRQINNGVNP